MTIEESLRAKLLTMGAVTAITETIRPDELMQGDNPKTAPCVLISVDSLEFDNTLDGRCDMVTATVMISAISTNKSRARALAEAIRTNGANPGTGLAGLEQTTGDLPFKSMLRRQSIYRIGNDDGSESALFTVDSEYEVTYYETV